MTFVLKEFTTLEKHYNDTIEIILLRDKKDSIDKLESPRKEQIGFLQDLVSTLKKQLEKKPLITRICSETMYGAMLLIQANIRDNSSMLSPAENSLLYQRLSLAMGLTDADKPTAQQFINCHKSLNQFLRNIYINRDSRLGLKEEHCFNNLSLDTLAGLITKNYELEEFWRKTASAALGINGKTTFDYKTVRSEVVEINGELVDKFGTWEHLKHELDQLIKIELADKNVSDISLLSKARASQLQFLYALKETLPLAIHLKPAERVAILIGAMHLIREQIGREYNKKPLNNEVIIKSVIHTKLTQILNPQALGGENQESVENMAELVNYAHKFIYQITVEPIDGARSIDHESMREKNPFAKIKDFSLKSLFDLAQEMIKHCRINALTQAICEHNDGLEAAKPKAAVATSSIGIGTFFGGMFGGSSVKSTAAAELQPLLKDEEKEPAKSPVLP
ncbi:MAG: type IV secretion protein Dot [bacterium]|nr:type IV secretion protein Dot [bacterium]